ncbi:leukocyte receptor cluster member 9 [Oncorhynchus kisutch]|uniref:Leukocyte receptor cluster member 9-like n=1 Tax=Oncorhynchus kisutch TaxID=8019 RepID=A0A8C7CRU4_ONCKI|nr:leukocyte receptor cluster member 9-like [Oncorhynchus kisutch]XP_031694016.1 leukocyte receptor cluster member 9-like [Oncorhynchus kisutch]
MASEETGVPLDSGENLEDRRAQEHRATEGPKTEVPASPSQDGPQVTAGQEEGAVVCQFFLLGKCRFGNGCRRSHSTPTLDNPEAVIDQENRKEGEKEGKLKKKAKGNKTNQPKDTEGKGSTKKSRMRTADDVISRILWDPSVEPADFVVGYVDRFLGVLERPFSEFNWDTDPCDCDYSSELALPRHRIQYFTHRGCRVWDRNNRTDRVFGSTGQCLAAPFGQEEEQEQVTQEQQDQKNDHRESREGQDGIITTEGEESLIKQDVENEHLEERNQSKTSIQVPESTRPGTGSTPLNQQEARRESEPLEEEVGKDSVLVVIADQMSLSQSESESRGEEGETGEEWKDYWDGEKGPDLAQCPSVPVEQRTERGGGRPSKRKPTHFITFRANTPSILSSFQHLQEELTSLLPSSAPHWLPPSSLHVTLCLLVLPGPAEVTAAGEMLQRFAYLDRNPPVAVSFPLKLKHFGGKVLYLSPQPQPHLQQLNAGLQEAFREQGWLHRDSFNPRYHLTLAKVKDQEGARVFEGVGELKVGKGVNFGRLPINRLHLCSMGMTGDGFYETLCLVNLR